MKDEVRTKEQLIDELVEMRQRVAELEAADTERKRAERALRESEERFRALVENSSDIVVVLNSDGGIRYRTPSIEYPLGYELGDLVNKSSIELVHPDDLPVVMNALNDAIQNPGVAQHVECRIRHKDGSWRVVEAIGNNLLDNPAVEGIVITAR
ncbi:MAG: PAS domain-containing protein, partial [Anaerolineae bacterium]|nr:PAS domain-containing protein [Anaerolineae bacterium]